MWLNDTYHYVEGKQRMLPEYNQWFDMKQRCTSKRSQSVRKSYVGCTIQADWLSYDVWVDWAREQSGFGLLDQYGRRFQIDKDLLGSGMHYSEDTCCFIPKELNQFYINNHRGFQLTKSGTYRAVGVSVDGSKRVSLGCHKDKEDAYNIWMENRLERLSYLFEKYKGELSFDVIDKIQSDLGGLIDGCSRRLDGAREASR